MAAPCACGVLDEETVVLVGDLAESVHRCREAVEMDREDGVDSSVGRDGFDCLGIEIVRFGVDIRKGDRRPRELDRIGASDKGER